MSIVSRNIPTLLRGVSQASDATKQPDHADIQENADSSPVQGLQKRGGLQYLATLSNFPTDSNVHVHTINRDLDERYVAVFSDEAVKVYDINGTEKTVNTPDGVSYLDTSNPRGEIKTVTVADYTFVVNTSVKTKMNPALTTGPYQAIDTTGNGSNDTFLTLTNSAIVFVNQATNKTDYTLMVSDSTTYTDPGTGSTGSRKVIISPEDDTNEINTNKIATRFKNGLTGTTDFDSDHVTLYGAALSTTDDDGFQIKQNGPVLWIYKNDGSDFYIDTTDSQGSTQITLIKDSVQTFTDLPTIAPNKFVVEVKGDDTTNFDNYYVKFIVKNSNVSDGVLQEGRWEETAKLGIEKQFDYSTMPHVLIRQADGDFIFAEADGGNYTDCNTAGTYSQPNTDAVTITSNNHGLSSSDSVKFDFTSGNAVDGTFSITKINDNSFSFTAAGSLSTSGNVNFGKVNNSTLPKWPERTVGDLDTAPDPSFIGTTINNVIFFRNRLGFLADDNVILSRVSQFFNFFPETVTTIIDSDPIDVAASNTKVSILKHSITMGEQLILFSDQTQFILSSSSDTLTPKTANVVVATEFESSTQALPVGSGNSIYYLTKKGLFAGVREYVTQKDVEIKDASDITIHIPKYIPVNIFKLAVSTSEDVLILLGTDNPNKIYINRWLYGDNFQKILNSWSTFSINSSRSILNIDFINSDLYMVIRNSDNVTSLEKLPFEPDYTEANATFQYHLDHKVTEATTGVSVDYPISVQLAGETAAKNRTRWTLPYKTYADMVALGRYLASDETSIYKPSPHSTVANYSSSYSNPTTTVTITKTGHGFKTGDLIAVTKTSGSINSGNFVITYINDDSFKYTVTADEGSNTDEGCTIDLAFNLKPGQQIKTITASTSGASTYVYSEADVDYRSAKVIIGEPYEMQYRFSQQRLTEQTPGASAGGEFISGRLQLHHFYLKYEDTGFFKVEVTPENRDTSTYKFTGQLLGSESSTIGQINLETGTFKVPVMSKADRVDIDIKNNTFLPTQLSSAEYEARFHMRSRRI